MTGVHATYAILATITFLLVAVTAVTYHQDWHWVFKWITPIVLIGWVTFMGILYLMAKSGMGPQ